MLFRKKFKNGKGFAGRVGKKVKIIVGKFFFKKPNSIKVKEESELIELEDEELYNALKKKAQDLNFRTFLFRRVPSIFAPLIEKFDPWLTENNLSERLPELTKNLLKAEAEERFHARKGGFTRIQINSRHVTILSDYRLLIFALNFALENEFFRKSFFQEMKKS